MAGPDVSIIQKFHCISILFFGFRGVTEVVAMVSLERKFDVLHHSIATFTRWLDTCSSQLNSLSSFQTDLESGHGEGTDEFKLRDLALQYKVSPFHIPVVDESHSHSSYHWSWNEIIKISSTSLSLSLSLRTCY